MRRSFPRIALTSILVLSMPRLCSAAMITWQSTSERWFMADYTDGGILDAWGQIVGVRHLTPGYNIIPTSLTITFDTDAVGIPANFAGGMSYPSAVSSVAMQIGEFSFTTNTASTLVGYPWACCMGGIGRPGDNSVQFIFSLPLITGFEFFSRSVYVAYFDEKILNGMLAPDPTFTYRGEIGIYSNLSQFRTEYAPEVVPEPGTMILLCTGLLGLKRFGRRSSRRRD